MVVVVVVLVVLVVACEGGGSEKQSRDRKQRRVRLWRDEVRQSCERQACRNPGTKTSGGGGIRSMDMCCGWVLSKLSGATQQSQDSSVITGQRLRSRARPSITIASWRSRARERPRNLLRHTTTTRCVSI
ncbi:unnamed protein product, partial [Ectocarpus fasciculatus]